ncbi:hypothetical protein RND81_07G106200 [Saponaria officinalis]|uniref:Uncharacterized protein n=1 Tax=Saponaria officinalis TaxID=3572 RepID=A0AAW1JSW0_SAPOF
MIYSLSFLPTNCAIGTCILSCRLSLQNISKAQKTSFKNFVDMVLLLHQVSPLKNCRTIVDLKLDTCIIGFQVPESSCLRNLKLLHLSSITFLDTDSFGTFFYACPLLQELTVSTCKWPTPTDSDCHLCLSSRKLIHLTIISFKGRIEVDAPNLAYLEYCSRGLDVALSLKKSDCLVTACLKVPFTENSALIQLAPALIKVIQYAKELQLLDGVGQYLTRAEDNQIRSFPNLVKFYIGRCSYDTWKFVTYWLTNLHRLETLIFKQGVVKSGSRKKEWHPMLPFSSRVNVIEIHNFVGKVTELVILKHFLGNAKVP